MNKGGNDGKMVPPDLEKPIPETLSFSSYELRQVRRAPAAASGACRSPLVSTLQGMGVWLSGSLLWQLLPAFSHRPLSPCSPFPSHHPWPGERPSPGQWTPKNRFNFFPLVRSQKMLTPAFMVRASPLRGIRVTQTPPCAVGAGRSGELATPG